MARARIVSAKTKKPTPGLMERSIRELRTTVESLRHMLESYLPGGDTPAPKKRRAAGSTKKAKTATKATTKRAAASTKTTANKAPAESASKPASKPPSRTGAKKPARTPRAK